MNIMVNIGFDDEFGQEFDNMTQKTINSDGNGVLSDLVETCIDCLSSFFDREQVLEQMYEIATGDGICCGGKCEDCGCEKES